MEHPPGLRGDSYAGVDSREATGLATGGCRSQLRNGCDSVPAPALCCVLHAQRRILIASSQVMHNHPAPERELLSPAGNEPASSPPSVSKCLTRVGLFSCGLCPRPPKTSPRRKGWEGRHPWGNRQTSPKPEDATVCSAGTQATQEKPPHLTLSPLTSPFVFHP